MIKMDLVVAEIYSIHYGPIIFKQRPKKEAGSEEVKSCLCFSWGEVYGEIKGGTTNTQTHYPLSLSPLCDFAYSGLFSLGVWVGFGVLNTHAITTTHQQTCKILNAHIGLSSWSLGRELRH